MACEMFDAARRLVLAGLPKAIAADPVERAAAILKRFYARELGSARVEQFVKQLRERDRRGLPADSRADEGL